MSVVVREIDTVGLSLSDLPYWLQTMLWTFPTQISKYGSAGSPKHSVLSNLFSLLSQFACWLPRGWCFLPWNTVKHNILKRGKRKQKKLEQERGKQEKEKERDGVWKRDRAEDREAKKKRCLHLLIHAELICPCFQAFGDVLKAEMRHLPLWTPRLHRPMLLLTNREKTLYFSTPSLFGKWTPLRLDVWGHQQKFGQNREWSSWKEAGVEQR